MTNPRPDEERLRTSDLADAGERVTPQPGNQPGAPRGSMEREVPPPPATVADAGTRPATPVDEDARSTPLFDTNEAEDLRRRWNEVQTAFVDEPRQAVERADELVAVAIKRLAVVFSDERSALEQQWARGDDVSTEDLRVALRRYRGFFDRLLSV